MLTEVARRRWRAGRDRETTRVRFLAVHRDPRYRKMTDRELRATALWRWRLSAAGQALRRSEQKSQDQADTYLRFVEYRRAADSVST